MLHNRDDFRKPHLYLYCPFCNTKVIEAKRGGVKMNDILECDNCHYTQYVSTFSFKPRKLDNVKEQ